MATYKIADCTRYIPYIPYVKPGQARPESNVDSSMVGLVTRRQRSKPSDVGMPYGPRIVKSANTNITKTFGCGDTRKCKAAGLLPSWAPTTSAVLLFICDALYHVTFATHLWH
jgi:hypothetical protein